MSHDYNQTYKHKSDTFEGSIKKIVLESEFFECLYPEDSLIRKQRLTLHLYDKMSLTTYFFPYDDKEKSNREFFNAVLYGLYLLHFRKGKIQYEASS